MPSVRDCEVLQRTAAQKGRLLLYIMASGLYLFFFLARHCGRARGAIGLPLGSLCEFQMEAHDPLADSWAIFGVDYVPFRCWGCHSVVISACASLDLSFL